MTKKMKSFTILEALISLMLMSIIIGLIFSTINLIGKQLSLFQKENTEILEYNLFNSVFKNDLHNSSDFKINDNQILFIKYDETEVSYSIEKPNVLRKYQSVLDTFKIKVLEYKLNSDQGEFEMKLKLLNEIINTNYFFKRGVSKTINSKFFYEN